MVALCLRWNPLRSCFNRIGDCKLGTPGAPNDVAYDPNTQMFYAVMPSPHRSGDREGWQFGIYKMSASNVLSNNQGTWQEVGVVDTNLTGYYLNLQPKLRRDSYGNVTTSIYPNLQVIYSQGTNTPSTWTLYWVNQYSQPTTVPFNR